MEKYGFDFVEKTLIENAEKIKDSNVEILKRTKGEEQ